MQELSLFNSEKETPIYKIYLAMRKLDWKEKRVQAELQADRNVLPSLNPKEKLLLWKDLSILLGIDSIITEYTDRIYTRYFTKPRYQLAFCFQNNIECIHQITYNEFVNIYYGDSFDAVKNIKEDPATNGFINWVKMFIPNNPYIHLPLSDKKLLENHVPHDKLYENEKIMVARSLIGSGLIEGVFIPTIFMNVYWFKEIGILGGFTKANEYIEADEFWHKILVGQCFKDLGLPQNVLTNLLQYFKFAFEKLMIVMKEYFGFLDDGYIGLNVNLMLEHSKYCFDDTLQAFGFDSFYNYTQSPVSYMKLREVKGRSTSHFTSANFEYVEK